MTRRKLKRYGLFRNFLGGALICLPLCILCWAIEIRLTGVGNPVVLTTLIIYLLLIVMFFFITKSAAVDYAETLITTFDKLNHDEA